MPEGYLHLTCEQRCQIFALLKSGHTQAHIARQIGVDPSTISRELARNSGASGYRFGQAHEAASGRRHAASSTPRKMTPEVVAVVEEKLTQEQWSPEQISGRLAQEGVATISHESIYRHVWNDKKDGGNLYLHLRHSGKKYNKRKGRNSGRGLIPNRVDIDRRPAIVATKSRIGDWEADTIIGARHQGAILSHVERKSKYTKLGPACEPHRNHHLRQRKGVRRACGNRRFAASKLLFRQALSRLGTRPQRTHQRPRQTVLPKRLRPLYSNQCRGPKGRG
jgi:IS30 family transposase